MTEASKKRVAGAVAWVASLVFVMAAFSFLENRSMQQDSSQGAEDMLNCSVAWEAIRDVAIEFNTTCSPYYKTQGDYVVGLIVARMGVTSFDYSREGVISPDGKFRAKHTVQIKPVVEM